MYTSCLKEVKSMNIQAKILVGTDVWMYGTNARIKDLASSVNTNLTSVLRSVRRVVLKNNIYDEFIRWNPHFLFIQMEVKKRNLQLTTG